MTTSRVITASGTECIGAEETEETVLLTAQKMTELGVGALPICGGDNKPKSMLTDRDVKALGGRQGPVLLHGR